MNKNCELCNLLDCCTLNGKTMQNCTGYTYYANDGESRDMEKGTYRGYEWKIRTNWGLYPSAYVTMPEDHPFVGTDYFFIDGYVQVNGGLSIGSGKVIGWDYGHGGDYNPKFCTTGHKWTRSEIHKEIYQCIDSLIYYAEQYKKAEEEEAKRPKPRVVGEGVKIYRAVVSINMGIHECYECGHMDTKEIRSNWFTSEEHAELFLEELERAYNCDRSWIEENYLFNDVTMEG